MNVNFAFTESAQDSLTWEDIETLESGNISKARAILARFVVDDNKNPVPFDDAMSTLGKLKISEIQGVLESFAKLMSEEAVNPQIAAS
jgi:hypothetical protein